MAGMILVGAACGFIVSVVLFDRFVKKKPGIESFKTKDNSWLQAVYLAYASGRIKGLKPEADTTKDKSAQE